MIEAARRGRLAGQALFVVLFIAILAARLLPLNPGRIGWPGPDLSICLALVWILRRPDTLPVLLIAALFLLEDILLLRPLGLWAAIVIIGTEAARRREQHWRELPFMVEWLRVAILLALMMLANRFALALFFLPLPPLGQVILQFIATAAAYPLVAGLLHWPFGLRRIPGDPDTRHR
ncbi:rod shape-determining protein MreD [Paracoccus shanxieyensis]|uniref:Rod shape-determining protein MreD n=1 Tax=Paracoccus shanxieyensis TaxID=2675752 RepID=A0A6L6IV51_9RHOB|nr:rod shape-determining protein MreD [Paracoccus shanxieyensis]MTH63511.1 rod shape-determining protein MreD [Paracoccus shanxieyensis]MTH86432.1 rod shape-determining protein MreD [Paracoccus shanxieyensis]